MNRWKDWYEQGKRDFERANLDFDYAYYEWACFTSEQAAEKAIKALGLKYGITLWGHSLSAMLNIILSKKDSLTTGLTTDIHKNKTAGLDDYESAKSKRLLIFDKFKVFKLFTFSILLYPQYLCFFGLTKKVYAKFSY